MAIESDVLVIGGGLAGMTAAIAAAEAGADARLVTAKQSTLRHASGLVDVLGYPPGEDGAGRSQADAERGASEPLVDPFEALEDVPEGHPYERVGTGAVREGLALFDRVVDGYAGGHTDANALVPTHGGAVKPTARYPESTAAGLASDDRDVLFVGFSSLSDFDAPMAAAHLDAAGPPFSVSGVTIEFPGDLRDDAKVHRYAELLEDDELPGTRGGSSRAALVERVDAALDDVDVAPERIGFPAVLGEAEPGAVRRDLEDRLGAAVFEVPMGPPSLPGIRLEDELHDALSDRGVRLTDGRPAVDYDAADGRVETVHVERSGGGSMPMAADQVVLATGGLVGRGIETDRERAVEPIFDCHVPHPEDRYEWFDDAAFGDHPFAAFGVPVDRNLRPLAADEQAEFENLRAAGGVLGGYDYATEHSGAGVSIATGYAAGTAAAEEVRP